MTTKKHEAFSRMGSESILHGSHMVDHNVVTLNETILDTLVDRQQEQKAEAGNGTS